MVLKPKAKIGRALLALAMKSPKIEDIDTSLAPDSYHDGVLVGPRPAMTIAEGTKVEFSQRFNRGADCFVLTEQQRWALHGITGQRGAVAEKLLCSDLQLRLQLTKGLIGHWKEHWYEHRHDPDRQYMFLTIITDTGNTLARDPIIDVEALRRRADKLLREARLDSVFVIEVQLLTNFPRQGHGGSHYWHVHCVATTDDPDFDMKGVEADLRASGRLSNIFGAPTVQITPIDSLAHLMRSCAYMLKAPAVGKRLAPHPQIPSAWTFNRVYVRQDEALRLGEALSQVELGQAVHSTLDGKLILRSSMKVVRAWHKSRYRKARRRLPKDFDVSALWAGIRGGRSTDVNAPYAFIKRGQSPSREWLRLAVIALDKMDAKRASAKKSRQRTQTPTLTLRDL